MSHTPSVAAVIVTYNRLDKLKNVLASLERQTCPPSTIIAVDNASTDGTAAYLEAYREASPLKDTCSIRIVTMEENLGGAGGFSRGMDEGYRSGADFVWVFDDDAYPEPKALESLLRGYREASEELGEPIPFACSMVKFRDGTISAMNNPQTTWDWGRLIARGQNSVLVASCSFVSVLIPRAVIKEHGLPHKEYFIWYDDMEYTLRIARSCPGIEVLDSVVIHDMGENISVNFSTITEKDAWKFAYGVRNEASHHLHHENPVRYLMFCVHVMRDMRRGGVDKAIRRKMYRQLIAAIRFNPAVDYPAEV